MQNPLMKANEKIIRKLYRNQAELRFNVHARTYNASTGEMNETIAVFYRIVYLKNPNHYNAAVVDKELYQQNDVTTDVSWQIIRDAIIKGSDTRDPVGLELVTFRPVTNMTAGIIKEDDTILWNGITYKIVNIAPRNVYGNVPAVLRLHLREA